MGMAWDTMVLELLGHKDSVALVELLMERHVVGVRGREG